MRSASGTHELSYFRRHGFRTRRHHSPSFHHRGGQVRPLTPLPPLSTKRTHALPCALTTRATTPSQSLTPKLRRQSEECSALPCQRGASEAGRVSLLLAMSTRGNTRDVRWAAWAGRTFCFEPCVVEASSLVFPLLLPHFALLAGLIKRAQPRLLAARVAPHV